MNSLMEFVGNIFAVVFGVVAFVFMTILSIAPLAIAIAFGLLIFKWMVS